ncbi:MAG: 16S rRNA (cytidine(1402)-2'-O)-methyltransferase [Hyphomicrobiales bacterium]|nr:16S rRNA (cytidine(1402)-2'-O)-methyltransferase [Hyphomicrobiales bacterium]
MSQIKLPAGLYITATPIGNASDITLRALEILRFADILLCEDTRATRRLLEIHSVKRARDSRILAYHDHSSDKIRCGILDDVEGGKAVALVSEAGMPLVSDPGYRLVRDALERGIDVTCAPGANAVLTALTLSGLPSDQFFFAGFPPSKQSSRRKFLSALEGIPATLIFFESPHRLAESLKDMASIFKERSGTVARELTKRFEEIKRGTLEELADFYAGQAPKGEMVVLVEGAGDGAAKDIDVEAQLRVAMKDNTLSDAARQVAQNNGLSRSAVYQCALALQQKDSSDA